MGAVWQEETKGRAQEDFSPTDEGHHTSSVPDSQDVDAFWTSSGCRSPTLTIAASRLSDRNGTILVAKELVVVTRSLVRRLSKPSFAGTLFQALQGLLSSGESASSGRLKNIVLSNRYE
jgi:hypothetical protein